MEQNPSTKPISEKQGIRIESKTLDHFPSYQTKPISQFVLANQHNMNKHIIYTNENSFTV